MGEVTVGREWIDAALAGGLAGDEAAALAGMADQFHTPLAMQNTAGKLRGVPAAQIAATLRTLASTDDLVGRCVKKPVPTAQEQRDASCYLDGKPRLPAYQSPHLPTFDEAARASAALRDKLPGGFGLRGTKK